MSAFVDDTEHFLRYATSRDAAADARTFVPRMVFGQYISSMVKEAIDSVSGSTTVQHVREQVTDVSKEGDTFKIATAPGKVYEADYTVLALGNMGGRRPRWLQTLTDTTANYLHDPWEAGKIADIDLDADILLIGTGLTAVDKLIELEMKGHRGKIYAASRHGLLPRPHVARLVGMKIPAAVAHGSAAGAFRSLREQMNAHEQSSGDQDAWRLVFDGLRADTQLWWQSLQLKEQSRFLRHLRTYYDVHRHRMAPHIGQIVAALEKSGQLKVLAARLESVQEDCGRFVVTLKARHGAPNLSLTVDRIINCTGPQANIDSIESPLLRTLVSGGMVGRNALGSGLAVSNTGQVLAPDGQPVAGLFAIGPLLISKLLESVAVPELRVQAHDLATQLLKKIQIKSSTATI